MGPGRDPTLSPVTILTHEQETWRGCAARCCAANGAVRGTGAGGRRRSSGGSQGRAAQAQAQGSDAHPRSRSLPVEVSAATDEPVLQAPPRRMTAEALGDEAARDLGLGVLRQEPPPARLRQPAEGTAHHGEGRRRQLARRLRGGRHPPRRCASRSPASRKTDSASPWRTTAPASSASRSRRSSASCSTAPSSTAEAAARPAGHRHLRGRHVRPAHHRQAGHDHEQDRRQGAGAPLRDHDRHAQERAAGAARRHPRMGREARHPRRDRARRRPTSTAAARSTTTSSRRRSRTRTPRSSTRRPARTRCTSRAR